ncbi:hypothetical protein ABPG75_004360 [Micractinium tetrahymenae]
MAALRLLALALLLAAASPSAAAPLTCTPKKCTAARKGECFDEMLAEIKAADAKPKGYGLIFYGDSIFESLRGTDKCRSCDSISTRSSCAEVPAVLTKYFGKYSPGVMGMSMDQSANLMWRLLNGQIPTKNKPKVVVINIGTNDFTNCGWSIKDRAQKETALDQQLPGILQRIKDDVGLIQKGMPSAKVVILGILPRGTGSGKGLPATQNDMAWPSHYAKATSKLNGLLKDFAAGDKSLSFVDCGALFIKGSQIDGKLMTDAVHPTKAGWEALAKCLEPVVAKAWA